MGDQRFPAHESDDRARGINDPEGFLLRRRSKTLEDLTQHLWVDSNLGFTGPFFSDGERPPVEEPDQPAVGVEGLIRDRERDVAVEALEQPAVEERDIALIPGLVTTWRRFRKCLVEQRLKHRLVERLAAPPGGPAAIREPMTVSLKEPLALKEIAEQGLREKPQRDPVRAASCGDPFFHLRISADILYGVEKLAVLLLQPLEEPLGDALRIESPVDTPLSRVSAVNIVAAAPTHVPQDFEVMRSRMCEVDGETGDLQHLLATIVISTLDKPAGAQHHQLRPDAFLAADPAERKRPVVHVGDEMPTELLKRARMLIELGYKQGVAAGAAAAVLEDLGIRGLRELFGDVVRHGFGVKTEQSEQPAEVCRAINASYLGSIDARRHSRLPSPAYLARSTTL